ncbi:Beta-lactamase-like protein 2 homolog [Linum grandiflorum]
MSVESCLALLRDVNSGSDRVGILAAVGLTHESMGLSRQKIHTNLRYRGHTDGHLALLHVNSHSLIVGDHCVGQGSAVLDITAGGNMTDYFQSTYRFIDISPHTLIPMHGRVNLWPKNMLCGYLKNRRSREASILKAIEMGNKTLIDIVANVYSKVDRSFWIPAASNVRLHVAHLADRGKLPQGFSVERFERTCGAHFFCRWGWMFLSSKKCSTPKVVIAGAVAVAGLALTLSFRKKLISK